MEHREAVIELRADGARELGVLERGREGRREVGLLRGLRGGELERAEQLVVERLAHVGVLHDDICGLLPAAEVRAEGGERLHGAAIAGLDGRDGGVRIGGARRLVQVVRDEIGECEPQPRGLARRPSRARVRLGEQRLDRLLEGGRRDAELSGVLGQRDELVLDELVTRRERKGLREIRERALRVVRVLEADLRGLAVEGEPRAIVLGLGEARGQEIEHAGQVGVDAKGTGQRIGGPGARVGGLQQ